MTRFQTYAAAAALTALMAGSAAFAGPGIQDRNDGKIPGLSKNPADVTGGTYKIDSKHTTVSWEVSHMGLSFYDGRFNKTEGTLELDPANIENSKLSVTIDAASVDTTSDVLDKELKESEGFFEVAKYPTITFNSTSIKRNDDTSAYVTGTLTMHGITKPATLHVVFLGVGEHPWAKKETIGFQARGQIKRSEFGVTGSSVVGDTVILDIAAELRKQ